MNSGKAYEKFVYVSLGKHSIRHERQIHINQEDCLRMFAQGYDTDGIIKESHIVFDIKQFGLILPHIKTLRRKLLFLIPESDINKWAENNEFYFMYHLSLFYINSIFVQIEVI